MDDKQWANRRERLTGRSEEPSPHDIRERTYQFAVRVVRLVKSLPRALVEVELGRQLMRAGVSIGANVEEADVRESKRDCIHKMGIARKEARETRYWLRLLQTTTSEQDEIESLLRESDELVRILSTIIRMQRKRACKTINNLSGFSF